MRKGLGLLLVLLTAAAGCGGDGSGGGRPAPSESGREGGAITLAQTSQPDYLDPALSYTVNGWEPMWLLYTPPLTYARAEGAEGSKLIPGLAQTLPEVSKDGLTYRLTLRMGLEYSDG